jgi:enoyl-CoA hydratase
MAVDAVHTKPSDRLVALEIDDNVAILSMDDGKNNLLSPAMLQALNAALDEIQAKDRPLIITGRAGLFSAGFDLNILKTGVGNALAMLLGGFKLARRLLAFPAPVVVACNGHAVAMGSFLLLSGDYRIGAEGDFKITANEVKIGLTVPSSAIVLCRARLTPAHFNRAVLLSELYSPETAIDSGFLDEVVPPDQLIERAREKAVLLSALDKTAHHKSKLKMRKALLRSLSLAIHKDRLAFIGMGIKRIFRNR